MEYNHDVLIECMVATLKVREGLMRHFMRLLIYVDVIIYF